MAHFFNCTKKKMACAVRLFDTLNQNLLYIKSLLSHTSYIISISQYHGLLKQATRIEKQPRTIYYSSKDDGEATNKNKDYYSSKDDGEATKKNKDYYSSKDDGEATKKNKDYYSSKDDGEATKKNKDYYSSKDDGEATKKNKDYYSSKDDGEATTATVVHLI